MRHSSFVIFRADAEPHVHLFLKLNLFLYFQEKEEVEGISVGAILSDYQRVRVENV